MIILKKLLILFFAWLLPIILVFGLILPHGVGITLAQHLGNASVAVLVFAIHPAVGLLLSVGTIFGMEHTSVYSEEIKFIIAIAYAISSWVSASLILRKGIFYNQYKTFLLQLNIESSDKTLISFFGILLLSSLFVTIGNYFILETPSLIDSKYQSSVNLTEELIGTFFLQILMAFLISLAVFIIRYNWNPLARVSDYINKNPRE